MSSDSPQDASSKQPSVPPPQVKRPASGDEPSVDLPDDTVFVATGDVAIPTASPVHRQYLDRTTTTSVITLGYRPTKALIRRVRWVGLGLAIVAVIAAAPAISFLPFSTAPTWARLVLIVSAIQLAYVTWMCLVPDWSTVRITMLVSVAVAAAYGFAMAVAIATPPGTPMIFQMDPVRNEAIRWCALIMALLAVATFFSGRLAFRWRKGYLATNSE